VHIRKFEALPFIRHLAFVIRHSQLASVIGLAPIMPGWKDRLLELLCIHGQEK
jgi:hypothetical protein